MNGRRGVDVMDGAVHLAVPDAVDARALFLGLAAAQVRGAGVEPFLLGGDHALHGEDSRQFILIGLEPGARLAPPDLPPGPDFPWQSGAEAILHRIAAFIGGDSAGARSTAAGAGSRPDHEFPFGDGVTVGWVGHELGATRLARYGSAVHIEPKTGRASVLAAAGPGQLEAQTVARAWVGRLREAQDEGRKLLAADQGRQARGWPPGPWPGVSRQEYGRRVGAALAAIARGDIYQVNLSQPLRLPAAHLDALQRARLFLRLWDSNPVPYPACISMGSDWVMALSPERYLARRGERMESRPIKGTRPRGEDADGDRALALALQTSAKDRAENIMIVDLVRNDLGRLAIAGGVRVEDLCRLETFTSVHHLVSVVSARLRPGIGLAELLAAVHPAGSMTGVPKIRAVEILSGLEATPRGAYAGGIGWFAGAGHFHLAMLIRSLVGSNAGVHLQVGGAIVADSLAEAEYMETLHKGRALAAALGVSLAGDEKNR